MIIKADFGEVEDLFDKVKKLWEQTDDLEDQVKLAIERMPTIVRSKRGIKKRMDQLHAVTNIIHSNIDAVYNVEFSDHLQSSYLDELYYLIHRKERSSGGGWGILGDVGGFIKDRYEDVEGAVVDAAKWTYNNRKVILDITKDVVKIAAYQAIIAGTILIPPAAPVVAFFATIQIYHTYYELGNDTYALFISDPEKKEMYRTRTASDLYVTLFGDNYGKKAGYAVNGASGIAMLFAPNEYPSYAISGLDFVSGEGFPRMVFDKTVDKGAELFVENGGAEALMGEAKKYAGFG